MKSFLPPLLTILLGVLSGVGTSVYVFWRSAEPLFTQAILEQQQAREKVPEEDLEKGWDFWTIEIENLANELRGEKERFMLETEQAEQRSARITTEQQELDALRNEIENLRREISERVIQIRDSEKKNIRTLALTYTNLSPQAAIALIRELDDVTVVKILSQMKPDVIGPIFEEMSQLTAPGNNLAQRAALLSEKIRLMQTATTAP